MIRVEVITNKSILNISDYDEISYTLNHGDLFRNFCIKAKIPISIPYIGGQYWADPIARLGHIAIFSDQFEICAYSFYQLDQHQRLQIINKKDEWKNGKFSGVIVDEKGTLQKFDSALLQAPNEKVVDCFIKELTLNQNHLKTRR